MKNTLEFPIKAMSPDSPVTQCLNLRVKDGQLTVANPDEANYSTENGTIISELLTNRPEQLTPPDIFLRTVAAGTAAETIPAITLTDTEFSTSGPALSAKGLSSLSSNLADTYSRLSARVTSAGCWFQPMIGRVDVLDCDGISLYSSPPQILECGAWQCCSIMTMSCSKDGTSLIVPATTLSVNMYRIEAVVASLGSYLDNAASIRVTLTPQYHPVDLSASAPYRLTRTDTTAPSLTVTLPGCTDSFSDRTSVRVSDMRALIPRLYSAGYQLGSASAAIGSFSFANTAASSAEDEISTIASALKTTVKTDTSLNGSILREISSPNGFRGEVVTVSGDSVVWADISVLQAPPVILRHHADDITATSSWEGTLQLTFADGSSILRSIGSPLPVPTALPALIYLPYPDIKRVEMWISDSTSTRYATAELSPSADATASIALDSSLSPVAFSLWAGDYPVASGESNESVLKRYPGVIVTASTRHPYTAVAALFITSRPITAIHPAVKSSSSWDFTRCHIYAFSSAGIFTVAFNAAKTNPASVLIDPRGVSSGECTAYTSTAVMALSDCGRLLAVRGARTYPVDEDITASSLEWFIPTNELRLHDNTGGIVTAIDLTSYQSHTLKSSATGGLVNVCWEARLRLISPSRATKLRLVMAAARFKGTVSLRADSGAGPGASRPLLTLAIDGQVNAPVTARLLSYPCSYLTISVSGLASSDFTISSANVKFQPLSS